MKVRKSSLVALGMAALAVPAAAVARPGHGHANGHGKNHPVSYVFKGAYGGAGLVTINHGNAHVRKGGLVGQDVQFDLTNTRLSVADTNGDTVIDATDVVAGDHVVVKARLGKRDPGPQPFAARHLVDQTSPADDSDDAGDADDTGDADGDGS